MPPSYEMNRLPSWTPMSQRVFRFLPRWNEEQSEGGRVEDV